MKVNKHEDLKSVQAIEAKIWLIFDAMRGDALAGSTQDYHVVLFLLSAYKDGLFPETPALESEEWLKQLENVLSENGDQYKQNYSLFGQHFVGILRKMKIRSSGFSLIIKLIQEIDRTELKENFQAIFDATLYRIAKSAGRLGGEYIQPLELTRLMLELGELPENARIFNPFAGLASFGVLLEPNQAYFGQELNPDSWLLGTMRMHAHNRKQVRDYVCGNSFKHWPSSEHKFDLVVANPPMGLMVTKIDDFADAGFKTMEQFFIENALNSISGTGKIVALFSHGWLFKGNADRALRQRLIEEDLIDMIISMPGGLLKNTGIPFVIVVISRQKQLPGKVRFVKADSFVETNAAREKVLKHADLMHLIREQSEDSSSLVTVDTAEITANDYNLNVPRYFQKDSPKANAEQLVKLKEILLLVKSNKTVLPDTGRFLRIRDLKDDKLDFKLDVEKIEEVVLSDSKVQKLAETTLLLVTRWRSLKPTLFEFGGQAIYKSPDILAFKVNEALVDYGYLINELHADYVQQQLDAFRYGTVVPSIRKEDLLEVAIKLPSLREQRAKVQGIYELSDKIKSLQAERNALAHGKDVQEFSEFASLKHTLGRPRQNILDWSDNLIAFLNDNKTGFESLNVVFANFYDIDMISALEEIKRDVNFITEVLEKGEKGLVLSEYPKQVVSLSDINGIILGLSNNGFNFKIKKLLLKGEMLKEKGIVANKVLFKTLLDNVLTNAKKYAFDMKSLGNEVVIELSEVADFLTMEIRNNGKPFPRNFDREKFIAKYSTADSSNGSGLGGYDIHRIASDFNNPDWVLSLNEDPLYSVKFMFQFPIKLIS